MKKFLLSIFAVLFAFAGAQAQTWTKVTDASTLKAGDEIVIVASDYNYALSTTQNSNNRAQTEVTKNGDNVTFGGDVQILTLESGKTAGTFALNTGNGYLYAASSSKNYLRTETTLSDNSSWTISISDGAATVTAQGTNTRNLMQYNNSSSIFSCYASATQKAISIYKYTTGGETPDVPVVEAPAAPTLPAACNFDDAMTVEITGIAEGATAYYSLNDENNWDEGTSVEITETTTVYAKVVKDEVPSTVVSATYTKNVPVDPNAKTATLSFASTAQRKSQTESQQVWEQNGVTFTNNKSGSTSDIINSSNPVRLYKSSEIIVECALGNIVAIEFDCDDSDNNKYLDPLSSIIPGCSVNEDKVTVALNGTSNKYELSLTEGQVRLDAITVTYLPGATKPMVPTLTAGGNFVGSKSVAITCATEGAKIYYTTNGDEPTVANGTEYSDQFEITTTTTVKAIAVNELGESGVATATYTRVAATPAISYDGEATFEESIVVTVNAVEGTTAYYTLSGSNPTNKSTEYTKPLTIKAGATLKVIAYDEDGYKSEVVEQKFVMATGESAGAAASEATLVTDASTLAVGDQIIIVASGYDYALSTTQNSNNRGQASVTKDGDNVSYGEDVQIITLEEGSVDGTFAFNVSTGYLYAASSSGNQLKTKVTLDENGSWAISVTDGKASITAPTSSNRNVMQYNQSSSLFSCYASASQKALSVYKVNKASIEAYTLSVSAAGWATLFLNYDAEIPAGVTCYAVSAVDGEYATLSPVTGVIPANTGVIVEASQGNYIFNVATKAGSDVASELIGTTVNTYITKEAYVLGIVDGVVGLYKAQMAGGVWLNNANKAYLPASVANGAASYSFRFGEGTTGISEVKGESGNVKGIYDLTGRRVEEITAPGIYVVNGKKVLVK